MSKSVEEVASLSIGDLAERTGVGSATLRAWETRYGFPEPHRLASGHRRYDDTHVEAVLDVVRRRDAGVRLEVAIEQAVSARDDTASAPGSPSVYARLRRTHPQLTPQRLSKRTLLALSWAIEDEFASRAQQAHLFGAFQRTAHFDSARGRWDDLARTMASTYVYADFDPSATHPARPGTPVPVALPAHHPMSREWTVVCDSDDLPVALTAWELPGQSGVRDLDRAFESVWTVEHDAVREAATVCAHVARDLGAPGARDLVGHLTAAPPPVRADLAQVTSLFNRVVAYVDSRITRHP